MMRLSRRTRVIAGAVVILALGAVLALGFPQPAAAHGPFGGFGPCGGGNQGADLAEALGISLEELRDAQQKAFEAAVDEAVAQDLLTETMAERIKERGAWGFGRHMRFGFFGVADPDKLLAEALGISVEKLQEARESVFNERLEAAVDEGRITAEQAERVRARRALQTYLKQQGLSDRLRSTYEQAVQEAVEAGVITQEQADEILSRPPFGFRGPGFGPGLRGPLFRPGFGPGPGGPGFGWRGSGWHGGWYGQRPLPPPSPGSDTGAPAMPQGRRL